MSFGAFLADLILIGHVAAAVVWWWVMPHGFPILHPRFWSNQALPLIVSVVLICARCAPQVGRPAVLAGLGALWIALAVSARIQFPATFRVLWVAP